MLSASARASRKANCAVGGHGLPVLPSQQAAQSPRAHNPGWPGTASVLSTITAPRPYKCLRSNLFTRLQDHSVRTHVSQTLVELESDTACPHSFKRIPA